MSAASDLGPDLGVLGGGGGAGGDAGDNSSSSVESAGTGAGPLSLGPANNGNNPGLRPTFMGIGLYAGVGYVVVVVYDLLLRI